MGWCGKVVLPAVLAALSVLVVCPVPQSFVADSVDGFEWVKTPPPPPGAKREILTTAPVPSSIATDGVQRADVWFDAYGEKDLLHTWFFRPSDASGMDMPEGGWPLVICGHGLGAQKDFGLAGYAERFAKEGFSVLVIDYRGFGGSGGVPRNYINPQAHVQDIKTIVRLVASGQTPEYVKSKIDTSRIALWGTSMAGGHVMVAAAELENEGNSPVRAIVSQMPHLDGRLASKRGFQQRGLMGTLQIVFAGLADVVRSSLGLTPVYINIIGAWTPEEGAKDLAYMLVEPAQLTAYFAKHPETRLGGWRNLAPARTALVMSLYNPIESVADVHVPALVLAASRDELCPIESVRAAGRALAKGKVWEADATHFEFYLGENLARALDETVNFLKGNV